MKDISQRFYAEMGNSKSKVLVEFKSEQLLFGTLWDYSSGLFFIPRTWPAAMTLAVRLSARGRLTPPGANRQAPVACPSDPKGRRDELGLATVLFAALGTVQWLRGSGCRRAVPSHLCTADSRRIFGYMVYPGARCGTLS